MNPPTDTINLKVIYDEEVYELKTYQGEYRNLMMLIYDKMYVYGFGDCKGMGRCATCVVEIINSKHPLPHFERNEEATIKKTGIEGTNIRLACQLMVDHLLHNMLVKIRQD